MKHDKLIKYIFPSKESVHWIYTHTKNRIPGLIFLTFCKIIATCIGIAFALVTKNVINMAVAGDYDNFFRAAGELLAIIVIQIVSSAVAYHLGEKISYQMDADLKKSLFHSILTSDFEKISGYHSGNILYRLNSDLSNITGSVITICTSVVSLTAGLISAACILISMAPMFALFIIPICAILAAATVLAQRDMKKIQKSVSASSGKLSGFMQEIIENLLIVQGMDITDETEKKADFLFEEKIKNQKKRKDVGVTMNIGANIFGYMGSFIALIWCAFMLLEGQCDYGSLVAITTLVSQLQGPMLSLPAIIPKIIVMTASTERVMEIEAIRKQDEPLKESPEKLYEQMLYIQGECLGFKYKGVADEEKTVLEKADFFIHKGGMTVITGPSGSGKSTLLKLLLGIYHAEEGSFDFKLDGDNRMTVDRSTRNLFAYAPQGNLLLSGSIRENIMIANPEATAEELEQALYVSCMREYIDKLPMGLETMLGENGAGLSEGQVQRVNLARAVLSGAPILLLDEVTSALDLQTEQIVLKRICALPDKTCIAVTHRPAALELATWELHVENGKVTEIRHS